MNKIIIAATLAFIMASGAQAADAVTYKGHDDRNALAFKTAEAPMDEGIVRKVHKATGKITLAHGPLSNGMAAMTMAFNVKDVSRLDGLKEGQKVLFVLDDAMNVVRLEPAK